MAAPPRQFPATRTHPPGVGLPSFGTEAQGPAIHLVHGMNIKDGGRSTTDRLRDYARVAGYRSVEHDYGWRGLLGVRLFNRGTAREIADRARPGDIGIGHSNGAAILLEAVKRYNATFCGLVLVNPALDRDTVFPSALDWVHVYHSPNDRPTWWAQFLLLHPWGAMGRYGWRGLPQNRPRVANVNEENLLGRSPVRHSDVFRYPNIATFAPYAFRAIEKAIEWTQSEQLPQESHSD